MSKEIMLNRMYAGNFLSTGDNIGHEVINLFQDDKGRNFIYVLALGSVAKEHNDKVQTIYLVRWVGNGTMEILAKAEELEQIIKCKSAGTEERQRLHDEQIEYIAKNDITYGGVRLDKLYEGNIYQGEIEEDALYVTYQAKKMRKPKRPIYIMDKEDNNGVDNIYSMPGITFSRQSPKMYYKEGTAAYGVLEQIASDNSLWEEENTTERIRADKYIEDDQFNFLKLIRKEYDEIVFSNMLQYYFLKDKQVFATFCRELLDGIDIDNAYSIVRETEKNIDLLVQDSKYVIVIENKIKSEINGVQDKTSGDKQESQLSKYYKHALELADNKRQVSCFIFAPDYSRLHIEKYESSENYKIIYYSEIYDFFRRYEGQFREDKYFDDFLKGLYIHTRKVDNGMYEEMRRKFSMRIMETKTDH